MRRSYESPETIELGAANLMIRGMKPGSDWDQPTMSFEGNIPTRVDVDEDDIFDELAQRFLDEIVW